MKVNFIQKVKQEKVVLLKHTEITEQNPIKIPSQTLKKISDLIVKKH